MHSTRQWTQQVGNQVYYLHLETDGILIGEQSGSGLSDQAVLCPFERFLTGEFHPLIAHRFGEETLQAVIAAVHQAQGQSD